MSGLRSGCLEKLDGRRPGRCIVAKAALPRIVSLCVPTCRISLWLLVVTTVKERGTWKLGREGLRRVEKSGGPKLTSSIAGQREQNNIFARNFLADYLANQYYQTRGIAFIHVTNASRTFMPAVRKSPIPHSPAAISPSSDILFPSIETLDWRPDCIGDMRAFTASFTRFRRTSSILWFASSSIRQLVSASLTLFSSVLNLDFCFALWARCLQNKSDE